MKEAIGGKYIRKRLAVIQDLDEAEFDYMSKADISLCEPDYVLKLSETTMFLNKIVEHETSRHKGSVIS